jgi:hypothetical protein
MRIGGCPGIRRFSFGAAPSSLVYRDAESGKPQACGHLFDFLLLFKLFDLSSLILNLALLTIYLTLSLLRLYFLILQRIADQEATACPYRTPDSSTGSGSTDRGADYCAGRRAGDSANSGALFTCGQWLAGTPGNSKEHYQCDGGSD